MLGLRRCPSRTAARHSPSVPLPLRAVALELKAIKGYPRLAAAASSSPAKIKDISLTGAVGKIASLLLKSAVKAAPGVSCS